MTDQQIIPLAPDELFQFGCRPGVSCFNQCCRDLHQVLTPYDVLRLRAHLGMCSAAFIKAYAFVYIGPSTGLPVAALRFGDQAGRACPFVRNSGCGVYKARPSSCRIYPLARGLACSDKDGLAPERFALIRERHCRGFGQKGSQTPGQWIDAQDLRPYLAMNDLLMRLITIKINRRPGALTPEQYQTAKQALYDIDALKQKALADNLAYRVHASPPSAAAGDERWLEWSLKWIENTLFSRQP